MKVVHVISGLIYGGTAFTLLKLCRAARFDSEVVTLTSVGDAGEQIRQLGVPVISMGMGPAVSNATALARLVRWLHQRRPDVVQTWQYHADLMGGLAARLGTDAPVLWNIRHSEFFPGTYKRMTLWTVRTCALLSRRIPTKILCCSSASRSSHVQLGYPRDRMVVVPNGFDLEVFRPDPAARASIRRELAVRDDEVLIGLIGNHRPEKDFPTFFAAAARLRAERPSARFALCGAGLDWTNEALAGPIRELGLAASVALLGRRNDMARLGAAFDVGCSSSTTEGMPNAIGEMMACGVPCAVTDVGGCAELVGDCGLVVPRSDHRALAAALRTLVDAGAGGRQELGAAARRRIAARFSLRQFVERYEEIYEESARRGSSRIPISATETKSVEADSGGFER